MIAHPNRYHPMLIALHWLTALFVVGNLFAGLLILEPMANTAEKLPWLRLHMLAGFSILALMVVRLVTRLATRKPPVPHASRALRILAIANHWLLYLVVFSMISTGVGIAIFAKLLPILGGETVALPASFDSVPPMTGHAFFAVVLIVLIGLHLAGAAYHRFAQGHSVLPRMGIGKAAREPS